MKLSYRGIAYQYEPPTIDMIEGDIGGQYRGQAWSLRYPRHIPQVPTVTEKYRGVAHNTNQPVTVTRPTPALATFKTCPIRSAETAKVHRNHIYQLLERRIAAAKARGDEYLLELLAKESEQMAAL